MRKARLKGPRAKWYIYYRLLRIIRRETNKAQLDLIIYGNCFVEWINSEPRHIPIQDVVIHDAQT
jgi:hypothetical protein